MANIICLVLTLLHTGCTFSLRKNKYFICNTKDIAIDKGLHPRIIDKLVSFKIEF